MSTIKDRPLGVASHPTGTSVAQASYRIRALSLLAVSGEEDFVRRVVDRPLTLDAFRELSGPAATSSPT